MNKNTGIFICNLILNIHTKCQPYRMGADGEKGIG